MKIVYRKSIAEQILDAQAEAARMGRHIEKIILTQAEADELKSEARRRYNVGRTVITRSDYLMFSGVRLEVEQEDF